MMFRSLFFVAPLVSADEQTAMLQLNRRGEVSSHNDMLVGSLEKSLMSKDAEKMSETAVCTYYLKTVHASTLLQKMSELKGEEKTHQLLQRAMDSVGAENLRSLEENLMSKDEDKKDEVKDSDKKLTPCEVLKELKEAFKHHMNHYREIDHKTRETGKKLGELIAEKLKESVKDAAKILKAGGKEDDAVKAFSKVTLDQYKDKIVAFEKEEAKKSVEALDEVIPKLKGSKMAKTIKTKRDELEKAVKDYEHAVIETIDGKLKVIGTLSAFDAPMAAGKPAAGFTQAEADAAINAVKLSLGKSEDDQNKAVDAAVKKVLKPYVAYEFKTATDQIWKEFKDLWADEDVLNTEFGAKDFLMETPPKCDGVKGLCLDIGDNLFWAQASGYLANVKEVEDVCKTAAFSKEGHEFIPRKVCDGDHPALECADEFLYLAKKADKDAKQVCTDTVEKTSIDNDTKLSAKKFTDIAELSFMADADTTQHACEKWEDIKNACDRIKA